MKQLLKKTFQVSGGLMLLVILLATFAKAWGLEINPMLVFVYQPYIVIPVVFIYYKYIKK